MIVWAHHMFLTGMGTTMSAFFQTTTMIISIPSVIILTSLLMSLWGGSIRFTTPMLFALAFLPMFGIGGLTGLPLGLAASDIHLHDTYYVVGHFHYVVAPGTIFALFAGVYYWFPKVTGRMLDDRLGRLHFIGSFVCMNLIFMPMFIQGLAGLNRRLYDGGISYSHAHGLQKWNVLQGWSAWALGLFQMVFILNLAVSLWRGRRASDNPWDATTLEWGTFATIPTVYRGAYQVQRAGRAERLRPAIPEMNIPYTLEPHPETGLNNVRLGVWLFLASEVMMFGGLFSAYFTLRAGSIEPWTPQREHIAPAILNTVLLLGGSASLLAARRAARGNRIGGFRAWMTPAILLPLFFVPHKLLEYQHWWGRGVAAATNNQWAMYFLLTGIHALHVAGGVVVNVWLAAGTRDVPRLVNRLSATALYWYFVDLVWLLLVALIYVW